MSGGTGSPLDAEQILELSRTLTIIVSDDGTLLDVRGGFGRFLGWDAEQLIGRSVFEFLPPDEVEELVTYFLENDGVSAEAIALTAPFRMTLLDPDGLPHVVDVIPTGVKSADERTTWVAVIVPVALFGSITRSLDLEMEGADRDRVKRMLCEELALDDAAYTNRWVLVDFRDEQAIDIVTSRAADADVVDAVRADVLAGWAPWRDLRPGAVELVPLTAIGMSTLEAMAKRGWQRAIIAPVHLGDRLVAVFFQLGRVPDSYVATSMKSNVAGRISRLVNATTLLMQRWQDEDQLQIAATSDALTGLHNGRSLRRRLENPPETGALLVVDIDRFKPVNDDFGHVVGDEVLTCVATRIVDACRDTDFVARVGGDEFVILLDGADADEAAQVAKRVIEFVGRPLGLRQGPDHVTVSVGQAALGTSDAFDAADQAMLAAKRAGRARLVVSADD